MSSPGELASMARALARECMDCWLAGWLDTLMMVEVGAKWARVCKPCKLARNVSD